MVEAKLADIPEAERKVFLRFLAHAPAKVRERAERWDKEKIPRSLHEIRSPVDEFVWRLKLFVECIDQTQVPTVEEYAAIADNKLEFMGTIIKVDQARSTASARGKQQEELDATVRVMHTYFRTVAGLFRCMRDNLIVDEYNAVDKA
ncbi:MAG: hypothetical protein NTY83_02805, partial [Candidatus Micrarchaeota archaeon]|nr:hypothetical protein [Candidatus Micrarchaeota archaeon]